MNPDLQALYDFGRAGMLDGAAVFLRIGAAMALLPAFGEQMVPQRVRLAVALAFTAVVAPAVATPALPETPADLLRLLAAETLTGLVFGFSLRCMIYALEIAGSIAAQSTSLSQLLGGVGAEPMPAIGHLLVLAGLGLAALSGLHVHVAEAFIASYRVVPQGQLLDAGRLAGFGVARAAHAFGLAFSLAAPFVIAAFIYNLALGVINRAMPQLMVVLIGAPAITGASLVMLATLAPFLLRIWLTAFDATLADPLGAP